MSLICKCYDETEALCDCLQTDYHFEYTECDSSGSRWRVAVPNPSVECSGLPDPVRGKECSTLWLLILQTVTGFLCCSHLWGFLGLSLMSRVSLCCPSPPTQLSVSWRCGAGIVFAEYHCVLQERFYADSQTRHPYDSTP